MTYLGAAATATTQATLDVNRRSDADLVERLQVVLRGAALGDPRIEVRDVTADHAGSRLAGAPHPAPFRIRQVRRDGFALAKGKVKASDARVHIAADCAADIAELLASDATWCGDPLEARHVAVLVGEWSQAELVRRALAEVGVPAVVGGGTKLLTAPAGDEWLCLLEALEQPHRSGRVRAAALTSFLGLTLPELHVGGDDLTDRLADRLRGWALLLRGRGRRRPHGGDRGAGPERARPRHGRRRAAAHRPAPRRPDPPRDRPSRGARAHRAPGVAPLRARRGVVGAGPSARQRRGRRPDHDGPPEQGPAVPRRPPALRLDEVRLAGRRRSLPRRRRRPHARRGRQRTVVEAPRRRPPPRGGRRGAARPLRRAHPRPVPGGHLVGAHGQHPDRRPAPAPLRPPAGTGRGARRDRGPRRRLRRGGCWRCSTSSVDRRPSSPRPPGRRPACLRRRRVRWQRASSTARSTPSGAGPPTPA